MKNDCIFCKITSGSIPAEKVFEDEVCVAFKDIQPKAPTHILVIPKEHFASLDDIPTEKMKIMGSVFAAAKKIAEETGIAKTGYRIIMNNGAHGGQEVFHIHLHLLGGKPLGPMLSRSS